LAESAFYGSLIKNTKNKFRDANTSIHTVRIHSLRQEALEKCLHNVLVT